MPAQSSEAKFKITIDGNADEATRKISSSARLAAKSIDAYESQIKSLSGDLRRLKGNSDEVNAAKKSLRERIEKAKSAVSLLTVELQKQGTTYDKASKSAARYTDKLEGILSGAKRAAAAVGRGLSKISAPVGKAIGKATAPAAKAIGGALAPVAKKISGTVAPVAKRLGEKFAPAGKAIVRGLAPAGRAAAKLGAVGGKALGKLGKAAAPVAQKILPMLGKGLGLAAGGATIAVAAVAAVGVAAGAAAVALTKFAFEASDANAKMQRQREALLGNAKDAQTLGEVITDLAGRVPQGVEELNALAVSLSKTRLSGKAIVDVLNAVAQETGAIDASAGQKLQEILTRTARTGRLVIGPRELEGTGIEWDEVAKEYAAGAKKSVEAARAELFNGQADLEKGAEAIRRVTEKKFGKINVANAFSLDNAPKKFVEQFKALMGGVDLTPISKGLQYAFGQLAPDQPLGRAVKSITEALGGGLAEIIGKSIPAIVEGFKWMIVGAVQVAARFYELKKQVTDAFDAEGWIGVGKAVVRGFVDGLMSEIDVAVRAAKSVASSIKGAFTKDMEIHSPSKVFKRYGEFTTEGYAQGVEQGAKRATGAVTSMVDPSSVERAASSARSSGGGGGFSGTIEVHIHGAPTDSAQAMQAPDFLASLTRAIRDAVATQAVAA